MSRDCRRKFDPPTSCVYISKIEGVARGCGAVGVVRSVLSRLLAFPIPVVLDCFIQRVWAAFGRNHRRKLNLQPHQTPNVVANSNQCLNAMRFTNASPLMGLLYRTTPGNGRSMSPSASALLHAKPCEFTGSYFKLVIPAERPLPHIRIQPHTDR